MKKSFERRCIEMGLVLGLIGVPTLVSLIVAIVQSADSIADEGFATGVFVGISCCVSGGLVLGANSLIAFALLTRPAVVSELATPIFWAKERSSTFFELHERAIHTAGHSLGIAIAHLASSVVNSIERPVLVAAEKMDRVAESLVTRIQALLLRLSRTFSANEPPANRSESNLTFLSAVGIPLICASLWLFGLQLVIASLQFSGAKAAAIELSGVFICFAVLYILTKLSWISVVAIVSAVRLRGWGDNRSAIEIILSLSRRVAPDATSEFAAGDLIEEYNHRSASGEWKVLVLAEQFFQVVCSIDVSRIAYRLAMVSLLALAAHWNVQLFPWTDSTGCSICDSSAVMSEAEPAPQIVVPHSIVCFDSHCLICESDDGLIDSPNVGRRILELPEPASRPFPGRWRNDCVAGH